MRTAYVQTRAVDNAYLVRERDRRRWRELVVVLAVVLPLSAAFLAYTRIHLEVIDTGYLIGRLEHQLDELVERERRLRFEASKLQSPERLERLASELGLVRPSVDQVLFVSPPAVATPTAESLGGSETP